MSDDAVQLSIPPEAVWGPTFDVGRATDAYIATVPAADRVKSDAYFEGGYWIELWSTLITVAVCACCCASGSRRASATSRRRAAPGRSCRRSPWPRDSSPRCRC